MQLYWMPSPFNLIEEDRQQKGGEKRSETAGRWQQDSMQKMLTIIANVLRGGASRNVSIASV